MKIIGLTGPSGTGKTTVSGVAEKLGFAVIDCDKIASEVSTNADVLAKLEAEFGDVVENGILNRKALAGKAFATKTATEKLNNIMLPPIVEDIKFKVSELEKSGALKVLLDAPTLFESGLDSICDAVIAVLADEKTRAERILKRDTLTDEQLKKRLLAAKPDMFYLEKTEHIIYNNNDLAELLKKAKNTLRSV